MICRPKKGVDPYYLLLFLKSNAGYESIQKCIRGQSGHIYSQEVRNIRVPKATKANGKRMTEALGALRSSLDARRASANYDVDAKRLSAVLFPSTIHKPVIAS
jgi:hypothetical protein